MARLLLVVGLSVTTCMIVEGCSGRSPSPLADATVELPAPDGIQIAKLDESRFFTSAITVGPLTVWPILASDYPELGEFLTLAEAQKKGLAEVREISGGTGQNAFVGNGIANDAFSLNVDIVDPQENSLGSTNVSPAEADSSSSSHVQQAQSSLGINGVGAGASVGTIVIENKSDLPILVCGGSIVKGGNQDRQIGQDFVIRGKTTVPVDAFCIEHGRWNSNREGQSTKGAFLSTGKITAKSIRASAQYAGDQSLVWDNVAAVNAFNGKAPATGTYLATIEEADDATDERRKSIAASIGEHFTTLAKNGHAPVGFAYAIGGKPQTVRVFAHPRLLADHLSSFVDAMTVESELAKDTTNTKSSIDDVVALVKHINNARETVNDTACANFNGVRRNDSGGNLNCYADLNELAGDSLLLPAKGAGATAPKKRIAITQDWTAND